MFKVGIWFFALFLAISLTVTPYSAVSAQTTLISDEQIQEQRMVTQYTAIRTVQEQFKLIQMVYIRHLERQIRTLESIIESR